VEAHCASIVSVHEACVAELGSLVHAVDAGVGVVGGVGVGEGEGGGGEIGGICGVLACLPESQACADCPGRGAAPLESWAIPGAVAWSHFAG
jgi:hypothetical protein